MVHKFTQTKLLIASGNEGKVLEIRELLSDFNIEIIPASDFDIEAPEETGDTFIENAQLKAKYYGDAVGLPALADDSGLCIDGLDGAPGVYSARWAGAEQNFSEAIKRIKDELYGSDNKSAKFVCALSLYWPDSSDMEIVEGEVSGELTFPPKGKNGFGYDSIFIPKGFDKTFAEIGHEEKQHISHRGDAFNKLIERCFK